MQTVIIELQCKFLSSLQLFFIGQKKLITFVNELKQVGDSLNPYRVLASSRDVAPRC